MASGVLLFVSALILCHAVVAVMNFRKQVLADGEFGEETLPVTVVAELIVAAVIESYGAVFVAVGFKDISASKSRHHETLDTLPNKSEFMSFSNRGRTISLLRDGSL